MEYFKKINLSFQAIILAVVLSITFFLLGLAQFKYYRSEMTILVIPRTENVAKQSKQIMGNIQQLPKLLSFYDSLQQENLSLGNNEIGKKADDRKKQWNKIISVKQLKGENTMFTVSISAENETDSILLAKMTSRKIIDTVSKYYDIKKDLDIRIVEGPITKAKVPGLPIILILSIVLGFASAMILDKISLKINASKIQDKFINGSLRKFNQEKKTRPSLPKEALENLYEHEAAPKVEDKAEVAKENHQSTEFENLQEYANKDVYPNFPEMPVHEAPKSYAPENLPIGDFEEFGPQMNQQTDKAEVQKNETEKRSHEEPTAEELKKRLNQLLRGE